VQRAILGYMVADRHRPWSAHELAERILGSPSTSAQFSIRRALANLGAAGTIAELPSDTAIKFWRMAANKRHRQGRDDRKRRREKDLRQARLDKVGENAGHTGIRLRRPSAAHLAIEQSRGGDKEPTEIGPLLNLPSSITSQ
jgi:hypothetical protein